jgi:beta-glucosidase
MKHLILTASAVLLTISGIVAQSNDAKMDRFINDLMSKMTLEEKLGQLNLGAGGNPMVISSSYGMEESARKGLVSATGGSDMNLQRIAVKESRLGIPILFGLDVIHGYCTTFPVPLAQASSWDLPLIERGAQIAAKEATACGISWTWSPMVDIARDARWGRIAEGSGEDPYLGGLIAQAMTRGYQGKDLSSDSTLLACFKHFALYGAAIGGRDYNTADMSRVTMYNYYLPPYKAAVDAGCGTGMSSFNVVDGIPASGNKWLLTDLLRGEWGFKGFLVSDAGSVGEMEVHRVGDARKVAELGINAGLDMDMGSQHYLRNLMTSIKEGTVSMATIDTSVRRILEAKYKLGLFDDPFRYLKLKDNKKRQADILSDEHVATARHLADESIVLLKNSNNLLPLSNNLKKIAVVGPIGIDASQMFGTWSTRPDKRKSHNVTEAIQLMAGKGCNVVYSQGSEETEGYGDYYNDSSAVKSTPMIARAVADVADADVIIACVGESSGWTGEAHSRVDICIPPCQKKLLKALKETGKPVVVVVFGGRPLILTDEDKNFATIVEAWHGGTQAADALADVLFGKVNPSAKTTVTFPRYLGQIPIYYNHLNTGRPTGSFWATSKYVDISIADNAPLYPFGYGLSYNHYTYDNIRVDKAQATGDNDKIAVSVDIKNNGTREGKEIVQLYVTDLIASISRPVEELKGFQKLSFAPGETKTVTFTITPEQLKFYNSNLKYDWEAGDFNISIGPNSRDLKTVKITWNK